MIDLLRDILTTPAGSFASVFATVIFLFFIVYKAGIIVSKFKITDVIQHNIDKMKEDIAEIKAFIKIFRQTTNRFAQYKSPMSLTDLGENVANVIHAKRAIDNTWNTLSEKIKATLKDEDNPYDIQQICFSLGEQYSKIISENDFDFIKKYAYKEGYNLSDFDLIFGILIRDKYFLEENIKVEDIDIHDPNSHN